MIFPRCPHCHIAPLPHTAHKGRALRPWSWMCSSRGGYERETLRKICCSFQPARNPPHHSPSVFRGVVCLLPNVPRNFADVLVCVASRQQGLGDIASQIGTYCNESSLVVGFEGFGKRTQSAFQGLLYRKGGPNAGPSRYQDWVFRSRIQGA